VRIAEGHHIRHWARGGPTKLSNLAMLCRRHHRAVHEEGYQIERAGKAGLIFRRPNGVSIPDVPDPPGVPPDPLDALWKANLRHHLNLHPHSMTPEWRGEALDVGYAIDVLHPRAIGSGNLDPTDDIPNDEAGELEEE
jgi:hypothetical protein